MDFYAVLGLTPSATADEIRAAFRQKAREYHPDRNPGDDSARERFQQVKEAHRVLSDPAQRARYDRGADPLTVADLFVLPSARKLLLAALPLGRAVPRDGADVVLSVPVPKKLLQEGGVMTIAPNGKSEPIEINVPPGGGWLRLPEHGETGKNGGARGELWVQLR